MASQGTGFVYVERRTGEQAKPRRGLLMAIDLECYDYRPGSKALVRASEGTVLERIPPRVKIREGAPMELPHIMLLMDDPEHQVIAPLAERAASLPRLYQTELMMGGGRVAGYQISDPALVQGIYNGIRGLADRDRFIQKYGLSGEAPLLFAVGDGNHSLATAKAVWERMKQNPSVPADHPARYALVEVVNIHDPALQFEPIHRVLFGVNLEEMFAAMRSFYEGQGMRLIVLDCNPGETANAQVMPGSHRFKFVSAERSGWITVGGVRQNLEVGTLQSFIDDYLASHAGTTVDYIHGDDVTAELAGQPGNVGFLVPVMEKSQLFKTVIVDGVLPRKTFSMGEANEKRYYLECRKIE